MTVDGSEKQLPADILQRADLRSNELAWHPSDIPAVIEAAKRANLVNLGGDLQVRAPSGKWGEPIGVGIDTGRVSNDLSWHERVERTARTALASFRALQAECDFEAIARETFPALVAEVDEPKDVIFFGWLVVNEAEAANLKLHWS